MKIEPNKVGAFVKCNLKSASKEEISEIKTALEKFGVLFFRNQDLDSKSYINLAKNFGNLADYPMLKGLEGFPEITVVERKKSDKGANFGGIFYHSDSSYTDHPPRFTMLLARLVPPRGQGNTEFASQYLAYEKLPGDYKKKIENLKGIFSSSGKISITRLDREKEKGTGKAKDFEAVHPIVKTINGQKTIYCSPGHVVGFKDLDGNEAEKLQNFLFNHQVKEEYNYSFEWGKNDLVCWDNRSILHKANSFNGDRIMHRITIQ